MNIVKCTNGHFFDSDKYDECPYCAEKGEHVFEERRDMDDRMTISGNSVCDMLFENQLTERYLENVRDDEKTVSLSIVSGNNRPVVGWLMCISGSQKGRALSVFSGRNFAGRAKNMDIRLMMLIFPAIIIFQSFMTLRQIISRLYRAAEKRTLTIWL
mgnify:CR=1 FL=1